MQDIIKTKSEIKNGIKYTTHYVNRSIRQGDSLGSAYGISSPNGTITTEIVNYVYAKKDTGSIPVPPTN